MDSNILSDFRASLYGCFLKSEDVLMNLCDALLTESAAQSFIELSLSPYFGRKWHSLYQGIQRANLDREGLQKLFAQYAPQPEGRLVLGVDASSIPRPLSETARDRTYVHASNLPKGSKPVVPGWQFSVLSVLPSAPSSWTYVLDNQRVESEKTQGEVAARQLEALVPLLSQRALLLGDGYYGSAAFLRLTQATACDKLCRMPKNRALYRPAPPPTGKRGRPRLDGAVFRCSEPDTPDATAEETDENGQKVTVDCWNNLHFQKAREVVVSVIRVTRHGAADTERDPRTSWFVFAGEELPPLGEVPALYARRYSLEHAFRFDKQDLMWEEARLRTPEQFGVWTDIVSCVHNELFLAREQAASRRDWERKEGKPSPSQVRRGMAGIIAQLDTPSRPVRLRGKSKGREKGSKYQKATRHKTVFKGMDKPKKPTTVV